MAGWMGQTSGRLGRGKPLFNKPLISSGKHKILGREFTKTTSGDFLWHGRDKSQPGMGSKIKSGVKDLFTRDNIANKYATIDDLNKGSGKGLFNKKSSPAENITPLDQGSGMFQSDATALQSDAKSGQIYGGTAAQREEAAGLASGGPAGGKSGGKSGGGSGGGASMLGPGLAIGSAALNALDDDPGYGGMDVGKEALQYASMGSVAGPVGAAVGAAVGTAVGLVKKKKFEKEEKQRKEKERNQRISSEKLSTSKSEAEAFFESQNAGSAGVYGSKDMDMFINKYAQ